MNAWTAYEKHEPGRYGLRTVIPVSGGGLVVAHVNCGHPDHEANARLVAAAPDLLAALEVMTDIVWQYSRSMTSDGYVDELAQARAAIAKAEGK